MLEMLSDLLEVDDILFVVKSGGATAEIRGGGLQARKKDKWITMGKNDDPAHMHIDSEIVCSAEFVQKERPGRTSFGVMFFDEKGERVLAAFFTKMYDESGVLIPEKKAIYDRLEQKYRKK